jgi:hypothetical protein
MCEHESGQLKLRPRPIGKVSNNWLVFDPTISASL